MKKSRFETNGAVKIKHRVLARRVLNLALALTPALALAHTLVGVLVLAVVLISVVILISSQVIGYEIEDSLPRFVVDYAFDIVERFEFGPGPSSG